jgi:hypothetical protein
MQRELETEGLRTRSTGGFAERVSPLTAGVAALLICGIASSILYVAADIAAALRYEGYSYRSQAISELAAAGAPTRTLVVSLFTVYNALLVAFAAGVWLSAGRKRALRLAGSMLAISVVAGQATLLFFPMDQRGSDDTLRGLMHGPMTGVGSLFILLAMWFAAALRGRRFRVYSYATMAVMVAFAVGTSLYVPRVTGGDSTPWMGAIERVSVYAYLLWVFALATLLLRVENPLARGEGTAGGRNAQWGTLTSSGPGSPVRQTSVPGHRDP